MSIDIKKDVYIFRKDLKIVLKDIPHFNFLYFWDVEKLEKEKRAMKYIAFLKEKVISLQKIIENQGGKLDIIEGSIKENIEKVLEKSNPEKIVIQKQYLPWEVAEENYLKEVFPDNIEIIVDGFLLNNPGEVLKDDGSPYTIFTPFYKKWQKVLGEKTMIKIDNETQENRLLEEFFEEKIMFYKENRDIPWKNGTSGFSKYLNCGVITSEEVVNKALSLRNKTLQWEPFVRQLAWRDFYYHLYYFFPHVLEKSFKKKYENLFWENNPENFQKWKEGKTGYPFVDAGMRQLKEEGIMHNRLRMITASFLTKDLLIDWKKGEEFFMNSLIDGDVILNNGGWQWSASTGSDAQPYFRIFNPVTQSKKFDPEGKYIKKYVPELTEVPIKFIHEPWKMNVNEQKNFQVIIGKDYPMPIVNHSEQRIKALELYKI